MAIAVLDRNTLSYQLLSLIAVSGELPVREVSRLVPSDSYREKLLTSLRDRKLLRTHCKDKLWGHRLTARAKEVLLSDSERRFAFFLTGRTDTNLLKSEVTRRLRLHRIAEATVTMRCAGVSIFRDEKPDVFYPEGTEPGKLLAVERAAFYNSREVKALGEEFIKISGARSVGILLTLRDVFVVYNTSNTVMKWAYKSEMRTKALMIHTLCRKRLSSQYRMEDVNGLILGAGMEIAYQLLTGTDKGKRSYFVLDDNYDHFFYLTNDHAGEVLLCLLCDAEKTIELNKMLADGLYPRSPAMVIENDAVDEEGNPVLLSYFCDLPRLTRFVNALSLHDRTGTLFCFDFQKEVLQRFCGERVQIETIDLIKFERRFPPENKKAMDAAPLCPAPSFGCAVRRRFPVANDRELQAMGGRRRLSRRRHRTACPFHFHRRVFQCDF